jgi:hypothetical protein
MAQGMGCWKNWDEQESITLLTWPWGLEGAALIDQSISRGSSGGTKNRSGRWHL